MTIKTPKFRPSHFHLVMAILMFGLAIYLSFHELPAAGIFPAIGGLVALLFWKASRSGILDN